MREYLTELLQPCGPEESKPHVVKRALGTVGIMLATLPLPDKTGYTPSVAAHMSDFIGVKVRDQLKQL